MNADLTAEKTLILKTITQWVKCHIPLLYNNEEIEISAKIDSAYNYANTPNTSGSGNQLKGSVICFICKSQICIQYIDSNQQKKKMGVFKLSQTY